MKISGSNLSPATRWLEVAGWILPVLCFLAILLGPVLQLAGKRQSLQTQLNALRANVYQENWLDSTEQALGSEVKSIREFHARISRALTGDSRIPMIADPLRQEAQALGCEVLRITPSEDSAGGMRRLRLRWETRADFASAMKLFHSLRTRHPEVYIDEALLRPPRETGAKLSMNLGLLIHLAPDAGVP